LTIKAATGLVGQKIAQIKWPKGAALVGLLRDQLALVPTGGDLLQADDTVYAIVTHEGRKPLVKLLSR